MNWKILVCLLPSILFKDLSLDEDQEDVPSSNSEVFSMTSSAPSVVISNTKPKVNPEDVTNTTCIRKGKILIIKTTLVLISQWKLRN